MRERDVPQEGNRTLAGHRKAVYAIADDGKLRLVPSRGWEVEEIVTRQAVEDLEKRAMEARARALSGESSPLDLLLFPQDERTSDASATPSACRDRFNAPSESKRM